MRPLIPHTGLFCCLLLAFVLPLHALDETDVPDHQSHSVGWQDVYVIIQAKDGYEHGQEVPADFLAGRQEVAQILNEYFQRFSYYRTGLRFSFFPYFVDNASGEWKIVEDAQTIDPDLDVRDYHRVWNDSWQGGAGRAFVGGRLLRTGVGDHYPARHELAHTYSVGHPDQVRIGDEEGANTKIRWGWIREDDPNGFAYQIVDSDGTYRIYSYGDADQEPHGVPGGHIALVVRTGDGDLAINSHRDKDIYALFMDDDRVDMDPADENKKEFLGLGSEELNSYRYTDGEGWSVDIEVVDIIPAQDGKPRAADIRITFPEGPKPFLEIASPETLTTFYQGEDIEIIVDQAGLDTVAFERINLAGDRIEFARETEAPFSTFFPETDTGTYFIIARGYIEEDGELVEFGSDSTLIYLEEPPDQRSITLAIAPDPSALQTLHLTDSPTAAADDEDGALFAPLSSGVDHRFGFSVGITN